MVNYTRSCEFCGADISDRHGNAVLCKSCSPNYRREWAKRNPYELVVGREKIKAGRPRKFTDEELLELYKKELSDRVVAKILRVAPSEITKRRNSLGLKPHYSSFPLSSVKFSDEELLELLPNYTIAEIAERLEVSKSTINRRKEKLAQKDLTYLIKLMKELGWTVKDMVIVKHYSERRKTIPVIEPKLKKISDDYQEIRREMMKELIVGD